MHSKLFFPFWKWELLAELTMNRKTFFSGAEVRVLFMSDVNHFKVTVSLVLTGSIYLTKHFFSGTPQATGVV